MAKFVPTDFTALKRIHQTDHELLPTYKCHKIVKAAKITAREADPNFGGLRLAFGDIGMWINVEQKWLDRNGPIHVGGYYIVYEDGYRSFSPSKQFEAGYTMIDTVNKETTPSLSAEEVQQMISVLGAHTSRTMSEEDKVIYDAQCAEIKNLCLFLGTTMSGAAPRFAVQFNLVQLANMRLALTSVNHPLTHIVIGSKAFGLLLSDTSMVNMFDPTSRYAEAYAGFVGHLFGAKVITEAYMSPDDRELPDDYIALLSVDSSGEVRDYVSANV